MKGTSLVGEWGGSGEGSGSDGANPYKVKGRKHVTGFVEHKPEVEGAKPCWEWGKEVMGPRREWERRHKPRNQVEVNRKDVRGSHRPEVNRTWTQTKQNIRFSCFY